MRVVLRALKGELVEPTGRTAHALRVRAGSPEGAQSEVGVRKLARLPSWENPEVAIAWIGHEPRRSSGITSVDYLEGEEDELVGRNEFGSQRRRGLCRGQA